jgi:hypothetical protein
MQRWLVVSYHFTGQDQAIQEESPHKGVMRVTAGFGRCVQEIFRFLGCYADFVGSYVVTSVSEQPIGSIFKNKAW